MSRLARPEGMEWGTTAWTVLDAYKWHQCADGGEVIPRGGSYVRMIAFPSAEVNSGGLKPWVLRVCVPCATRYGRRLPPTWAERRRQRGLAAMAEEIERFEKDLRETVLP